MSDLFFFYTAMTVPSYSKDLCIDLGQRFDLRVARTAIVCADRGRMLHVPARRRLCDGVRGRRRNSASHAAVTLMDRALIGCAREGMVKQASLPVPQALAVTRTRHGSGNRIDNTTYPLCTMPVTIIDRKFTVMQTATCQSIFIGRAS